MAAFQATLKKTYIRVPEFFGTGLDDLVSSGTYTATAGATYTIIITTASGTDIFKWQKDDDAFTTAVNITGAAQTLSDGVIITFDATTGHTVNEKWVIEAIAPQIDATISADGTELTLRDHSNYLTNTESGHALTDFTDYRRVYITPLNGTEIDLNEISAILPPYDGSAANSNVFTYSSISVDDAYELKLVTVPTWSAGTYTLNMCVWSSDLFYIVNVASTTGVPGTSSEWTEITEDELYTAYYEESILALSYLLSKGNDEYVHEFHCVLHSECAGTFCKNENSIKMFKSFIAVRGADIGTELGEWNKVQIILTGGNNLFS